MSMPPEHNRRIEDLLKAWAQRRRGQAGGKFEMHAATHRLLQGEVARTFGTSKPEIAPARVRWWDSLWLRVGAACCLVAVISAIVIWGGKPNRTEVAQLNGKSKPALDRDYAKTPAIQSERALDRATDASRTRKEPKSLASSASPAPATAPAPSGSISAPPSVAQQPVIAARRSAPQLGVGKQVANETTRAQKPEWQVAFQRVEPAKDKNSLADSKTQVLSSFTVQRNGQKIRVIDSDGSIYEGEIIAPPASDFAGTPLREVTKSAGTVTLGFSFRVAGINKQLNQPVVFSGTIPGDLSAPQTPPQPGMGGGGAVGGAAGFQSKIDALRSGPSQNTFLTGQLQIGGTNQIPIQAMRK